MKNKEKIDHKNTGKYLNIPFQMLVIIGLGVFAGIKLDKVLNFQFPVFTLILTLLSIIIALYVIIKGLLK